MNVEYLIILKQDDNFCNSIDSFKKFLTVDSTIKFENNLIIYIEGRINHKASYKLKTGLISEKNEQYFLLELKSLTNNIDNFNKLCHKIKKIVNKINPGKININTLWDGIGRNYAIESYPYIFDIENLLRKFITRFMLINIGMDWVKTEIHSEIKKKIVQKNKNNDYNRDELYYLDFIELYDVLFKKLRIINQNELDKLIENAEKSEDLNIQELKKALPKSNWEKYFSEIINYNSNEFEIKWKELYDKRNDIAHNRYISKNDFERIKKLTSELNDKLSLAINNLNEINIDPEDKVLTLESYNFPKRNVYKLFKVAKDLNIATSTIVEFLHREGFKIENKPTAKITSEMFETLIEKFNLNIIVRNNI